MSAVRLGAAHGRFVVLFAVLGPVYWWYVRFGVDLAVLWTLTQNQGRFVNREHLAVLAEHDQEQLPACRHSAFSTARILWTRSDQVTRSGRE